MPEDKFPQKSPVFGGSCAERDLELKASYVSSLLCNKDPQDTRRWMGDFSAKEPYFVRVLCAKEPPQLQGSFLEIDEHQYGADAWRLRPLGCLTW